LLHTSSARHPFADGRPIAFQSVLGSSATVVAAIVLVEHGVPRSAERSGKWSRRDFHHSPVDDGADDLAKCGLISGLIMSAYVDEGRQSRIEPERVKPMLDSLRAQIVRTMRADLRTAA
jgi:hypothetical protein